MRMPAMREELLEPHREALQKGYPPWGMRGFVHLYTGDGKGKTTAAFGLALRAAAAGARVAVLQLVKSMAYSECALAQLYPRLVTVEQCGLGCSFDHQHSAEDRACAEVALLKACNLLEKNSTEMLILDELTVALKLELVPRVRVEAILASRQPHQELVITGRDAPDWLIERADLVTHMGEVKHYYRQGVLARLGIEH